MNSSPLNQLRSIPYEQERLRNLLAKYPTISLGNSGVMGDTGSITNEMMCEFRPLFADILQAIKNNKGEFPENIDALYNSAIQPAPHGGNPGCQWFWETSNGGVVGKNISILPMLYNRVNTYNVQQKQKQEEEKAKQIQEAQKRKQEEEKIQLHYESCSIKYTPILKKNLLYEKKPILTEKERIVYKNNPRILLRKIGSLYIVFSFDKKVSWTIEQEIDDELKRGYPLAPSRHTTLRNPRLNMMDSVFIVTWIQKNILKSQDITKWIGEVCEKERVRQEAEYIEATVQARLKAEQLEEKIASRIKEEKEKRILEEYANHIKQYDTLASL